MIRGGTPASRGVAATTVLALLLALTTAFFAVRASWWRPDGVPPGGLFGAEGKADAEAMVARLCRGVMRRQQPDGAFDPGEYTYEIERVSATALATAALVTVQQAGDIAVPGLDGAVTRGLDYLKKKQVDTGLVGFPERKDRWSQVDATSAAILAFGLAGRPEDQEALARAVKALRRTARERLRNGWTRGLAVMTVDALVERGQGDVFGDDPYELVDIRDLKQAPREGPPQTSDWNVAEVICRVVRGLRKGVDPFPAELVRAILDEPAEWNYPSTDCAAWWMQSWLVARSGAPEAGPWFQTMRTILAEEATGKDDAVQGGWYANTVTQTSGAILALMTGLSPQVVAR
ncbi:MAG: hypothetical protein P1V36_18125 [Planctomycetota bacterium]|nr:hypothetical protein [Planctomycetota bacterium]